MFEHSLGRDPWGTVFGIHTSRYAVGLNSKRRSM